MINKLEKEIKELENELKDLLENFDGMDKEIFEVLIFERWIKGLENKLLETNENVSKIEEYLKTNDSILTQTEKDNVKKSLFFMEFRKLAEEYFLSNYSKIYEDYKPMESNENLIDLIFHHEFSYEEFDVNKLSKKGKELGVI